MRLITIHLPIGILATIEEFLQLNLMPDRSAYIRDAVVNQLRVDIRAFKNFPDYFTSKRDLVRDGAI